MSKNTNKFFNDLLKNETTNVSSSGLASKGYLNILKQTKENNFSFDSNTCSSVAKGDYLEVLK